jgi:predicted molibdopterin-dependent oxidoreductase YjgC
MGALPNVFTGYQAVANEDAVKKFEAAWDVKLSRDPGMKLTTMFPAALDGDIKAMYIMGENPVMTDPDSNHIREALSKLDFFVFQDMFLNETAEYAHVILPACSYAEKDGTFTNTERRVQRIRKAIEPIGESKDDCWIIGQIAKRMGAKGFDYPDAGKIMEEIARLTPSYGGITYKRLEEGSLQWPCLSEDHPGTCIMHEQIFARPSGKGNFVALKYRPPVEPTTKEYPILLITGRRLYHYHATMTRKVDVLNILMNEEECQINPVDAASLGINQADIIQVTSSHGEVKVRARVTDAVPPGVVHMAFHFSETPTNELISSAKETLDPVTGTPAYKNCPVKISRQTVSGKEAMLSALIRASREPTFIDQLKFDREKALKGYQLNDAEKAAIFSGDVTKIESLTGKLTDRLRVWLLSRSDQEKW